MKKFEDLRAFQRATELMLAVYKLTATFPTEERYGLTSQIRRASVSVMNHIAEGQGRLTNGEWRQFLSQARGSLYEVQAEAIAAHQLGFLTKERFELLLRAISHTAAPLAGLIEYVLKLERQSKRRRDNVKT